MSAAFDAMTAMELRGRIARREVSPVEVTRRALEKAEATQGSLNAFFILMPDKALAAAKAAEDAVMRGDALGPLHGVPFSAKDLIAVGGERFAFGSRCMADNIAAADAPPVERAKQAGAILIGKTTTSEFGCKAVGDSPLTGITRNPWNLAKDAGRLERGRGVVGRRRRHVDRARHRRRRLDPHSRLPDRSCRHQGTVRPHPGVAGVGDHDARPCRPDGAHGRGRGAAVHGLRRLRRARSLFGRGAGAGPARGLQAGREGLARRLQPDARLCAARCRGAARRRRGGQAIRGARLHGRSGRARVRDAIRSISGRRNSTPARAHGCGRSSNPSAS